MEETTFESITRIDHVAKPYEEDNYLRSLGESEAIPLLLNQPSIMQFLAPRDTSGESGTPDQIMDVHGQDKKAEIV